MNGGEYQISAPWIGGIVAGICTVFGALVGALYHRDQKKFGILFDWKDELTKELPKEYVRQPQCNQNHERQMELIREIIKPIAEGQKRIEGLLERHIGVDGGSGPQH